MIYPGKDGEEGDSLDLDAEASAEELGEAEAQLALGDEDDALPWLESDEDFEEQGMDTRLIVFVLLAILLLAAILLGGWFFLKDRGAEEVVADGSMIEAPEGPYRERPENPGGTQVAGTGDTSFEVGEGQGREGRLAEGTPDPAIDVDEASSTSEGIGVQIGAFGTRDTARTGWQRLRAQFNALDGFSYRIVEASVDSGTIYRLQAVADDRNAANALCSAIKAEGGDCQVKG